MEYFKQIIFYYGVALIALAIGMLSIFIFNDDNAIEEVTEEIIKEETGVDIDISPESPEENENNHHNYHLN